MSVIPKLTPNAIQRMFSGEEVDKPILQILASKIVNSFDVECLGLVLSDGEHFNAFYVVPQAHQLKSHYEFLRKLTVLQVDKYESEIIDTPDAGEEYVIVLEGLNVLNLGSEIGHTIGNPRGYVNVCESEPISSLSTPEPRIIVSDTMYLSTPELRISETCTTEPNTPELNTPESPSTPESLTPVYCTPTKPKVVFKWNTMSEKAPLTSGVIPRIMAGEYVEKPIIQIMTTKMCRIGGRERLRLMVTDGKKSCYIYCCAALTRFHEELEKLSVVQLEVYVKKRFGKVGRLTVIFAMTGLNRGSDISFQLNLQLHRAPLSSGVIAQLVNEDEWLGKLPVVQIVEIKNIGNTNKMRTRLLISDGHSTCYAWLGSHLTLLHRALTNLSIIRLNNYKTNRLNDTNCKSITIYELSILNQGIDACFKWNIMRHRPATLSADFLDSIYAGYIPPKPVLQVMSVKKIQKEGGIPSLRLVVSDGANACNAWLPAEMTHLFGELSKLPIVRFDNYMKNPLCCGHFELIVFEMTGLRRTVVRVGRKGHSKVPRRELLRSLFAQSYYEELLEFC